MTKLEREYRSLLRDGDIIAENYRYKKEMTDEEFERILDTCYQNYGEGTKEEFVRYFLEFRKKENAAKAEQDLYEVMEKIKQEIEETAKAIEITTEEYAMDKAGEIVQTVTAGAKDHRQKVLYIKAANAVINEITGENHVEAGITGPVYDNDRNPSYFK